RPRSPRLPRARAAPAALLLVPPPARPGVRAPRGPAGARAPPPRRQLRRHRPLRPLRRLALEPAGPPRPRRRPQPSPRAHRPPPARSPSPQSRRGPRPRAHRPGGGMSPPSLPLCAWLPAFRLQAACGGLPAAAAMATERQGPLELVAAANLAAIQSGIHCGMAVAQALGRCPAVQPWPVRADAEAALSQRLLALADRISPRVQPIAPDLAVLDFAGLQRLHGSAQAAAAKMEQAFAPAGLTLRTGIAAQPAMALLAAKSGQRRLPAGQEAEALAPLPLAL